MFPVYMTIFSIKLYWMFPVLFYLEKIYATTSCMTIFGPVAVPIHRDASADHAGGWLVGFAFLCSGSFCFT